MTIYKIYKITSPNTEKVFIGLTKTKCYKTQAQKYYNYYLKWLKDNNYVYSLSYEIFKVKNWEITLLEETNDKKRKDFYKREYEPYLVRLNQN